MNRNVIETVLGGVVLAVAAGFLFYSFKTANVATVTGYKIIANFSSVGGLKVGDEVQVSGVKVGQVSGVALNPETFLADVTMDIDNSVKVPDDSVALISSQSLLGGKYLALQPGGSDIYLKDGGKIEYTQAPQNLEELLGKFIFSVADKKGDKEEAEEQPEAAETAPAEAAEQAPLPDTP